MIKEDRFVTYRQIEASLRISQTSKQSILHEHLGDETWKYSYEPESKQQSTVWVFNDEPNPTEIVRSRNTSKKMIACFFGCTGHVATIPLEDRRTVNAEWYTAICLPTVFDEIRKKTKIEKNIELMSHCPYSLDLSPNNFSFFSPVKQKIRGQRCSSPQEAIEDFQNHVSTISALEWKKCIDLKGEYFEKQ
ncbi:unnamed protein product [Psylliodes chrysocephalus]|uniref:Uncharacterized protein n=1 Tax=Psylliodes chrysocephalus TaxID=3402493 RepID=A0A9P0GDL7_9CUCU|nr:unnamed protein product [Psylliodes chrysocephala]